MGRITMYFGYQVSALPNYRYNTFLCKLSINYFK